MKKAFKFILLLLVLPLYAVDDGSPPTDDGRLNIEQRDIEALRDWINTKRKVTIRELGGNLSLSGEVRAAFQSANEEKKESNVEMKRTSTDFWDVKANLLLDYRANRTWAAVKLKFDDAEVKKKPDDTFQKLSFLSRAYLGGRVVDADTYTIDLEIGRRALGETFDSCIEFGSTVNGILCKYNQKFDSTGDLYFQGGPFLVDGTSSNYACIGEVGLLDIAHTGFYSKISAIVWDTKHVKNETVHFIPIQWIWGYEFTPKSIEKMVKIYAASLYNPRAEKVVPVDSKLRKEAWACYAGFSIGKLVQKNDWAFDINYQWVQQQAIPKDDGSGIGRVGSGNYRGVAVKFDYLLTKNLTFRQTWKKSVNNLKVGTDPTFSYRQYRLEFVYAF